MLDQRTGVQDTGDAQRAPEGAAALRQREASRIGMQMRSPTRQSAGRIGDEAESSSAPDRDHAQQLGGRCASPTTHTGALRPRASYHDKVYPYRPPNSLPGWLTRGPPGGSPRTPSAAHSELASGSGTSGAERACDGFSVSGRISIRQPVSRAANRAFWPSRPIANESW